MRGLSPLELAALDAIFAEAESDGLGFVRKPIKATVNEHENTGGGFFTTLRWQDEFTAQFSKSYLGERVYMSVEGMDFGLGMILHLRPNETLLEGYAVAPEDTRQVDFEHVRFAIVAEPGPYIAAHK